MSQNIMENGYGNFKYNKTGQRYKGGEVQRKLYENEAVRHKIKVSEE